MNINLATNELDPTTADEEIKNIASLLKFDEINTELNYSNEANTSRIQAKAEGITEGRIIEKLDIAKRMLNDNYDISEIKALTELSENEILQLLNVSA